MFTDIYKRKKPYPGLPRTTPSFNPNAGMEDYGLDANNRRSNAAMTGAGATGAGAEADYLKRAQGFDPNAAIQKYASSAWDTAMNDPVSGLKRSLADLRGSAVAGGRLDTGFFDQDQGDVVQGAVKDFNNTLGRTAIAGAGMEMENTAGIGAYGERKSNQYLDLLTAQREEQTNAAREKAERKRRKKRGIGSLIGGTLGAAGGFFAGGPQGAMAGWGLGSAAGGQF